MKTLINIPDLNLVGGVSQIYHVLRLNDFKYIDYFTIMDEKEKSRIKKMKRLILKYIKYIFYVQNYDTVVLNPSFIKNAFLRDSLYCLIAKLSRKKIIIFWHGWEDSFEKEVKFSLWKKKLFEFTYGQADLTLVLGTIFQKKLQNLGAINTKFILMTSIADDRALEKFNIEKKFDNQKKKEKLDFLFLSRIEKEKGIYITIDAIDKINKMKGCICMLHIAGSGSELEKVKKYVIKNNIKNIVFHGYVSGEKKFQLLEETDIFFFPTYFGEGLPNSILEAMLYAHPIISRFNAGISDHIRQKENGFLTSGIDANDFIPFINYFIENRDEIERIGKCNYQKAMQLYTAKKVKEKYLNIINGINDGK